LLRNPDGTLTEVDTAPNPRWVGTERTLYDNKANPVKTYEPYFAPDEGYDTEPDLVFYGVTPVLHYDPLGRLVRTDFPDDTFGRVEFTAWEQTSWDQNDTVLDSGWYATRAALPVGDPERRAAELTAHGDGTTPGHANTASVARLDPLGRTYLTLADNGTDPATGIDITYSTRVQLDIAGNHRTVTDARDITVLRQAFDMLGHVGTALSSDAGQRWALSDVADQPVRSWDSRGNAVRLGYDELRRPTHRYTASNGPAAPRRERRYYGEAAANPEASDLRTRLLQLYDGAGVVVTERYDFKGNVTSTYRRVSQDGTAAPDWARLDGVADPATALGDAAGLLATPAEPFRTRTDYDALNRPTLITSPDGSRTTPGYNEANLLARVDVDVRGGGSRTMVTKIAYNARGQQLEVAYANRTSTTYTYDPRTFRLTNLTTAPRPAAGPARRRLGLARRRGGLVQPGRLQSLTYTYDPVGNVLAIADGAQQTLFFNNAVVTADRGYVYDPVYRLRKASGREHIGQSDPTQPGPGDPQLFPVPHANDGQAMRTYTETYDFDGVGNLLTMGHRANSPAGDWIRRYQIAADSNRLASTSQPGDPVAGPYSATYGYDAQGNTTTMPHLNRLDWDEDNRLGTVDLGGGGTAYYQHDAAGQRVRATVQSHGGTRVERLYLGSSEYYRRYLNAPLQVERETLHVMAGQCRIALVETVTTTGGATVVNPVPAVRYQLADRLGSAAVELDDNGAVLSFEEYHPYGTTSFRSATGIADVSLKRYRFTGKERDAETGFCYFGARYYAAWLGRWASSDPSGFVDGPNLYTYVRNNPVSRRDPVGRASTGKTEELIPGPLNSNSTQQQVHDVARAGGRDFSGEAHWDAADHYWHVDQFIPFNPSSGQQTGQASQPTETSPPSPARGSAAASFAVGAAKAVIIGSAIEFGVGFAAGLTGIAVGTIGLALGAVLLPLAIYGAVTNWEKIKASAKRLRWDVGTPDDYEAAGNVVGGLMAIGASGAAQAIERSALSESIGLSSGSGTWARGAPSSAAQRYAVALERPGSSVLLKRGSLSLRDLGSLASSQETEFAVIRLEGERLLVRGSGSTMSVPPGSRLIAHVHPGEGFMGLTPSVDDMSALEQLGQHRSAILNESGTWRVFSREGPSGIVRGYRTQ
jgi:RHS repeat-associated protein